MIFQNVFRKHNKGEKRITRAHITHRTHIIFLFPLFFISLSALTIYIYIDFHLYAYLLRKKTVIFSSKAGLCAKDIYVKLAGEIEAKLVSRIYATSTPPYIFHPACIRMCARLYPDITENLWFSLYTRTKQTFIFIYILYGSGTYFIYRCIGRTPCTSGNFTQNTCNSIFLCFTFCVRVPAVYVCMSSLLAAFLMCVCIVHRWKFDETAPRKFSASAVTTSTRTPLSLYIVLLSTLLFIYIHITYTYDEMHIACMKKTPPHINYTFNFLPLFFTLNIYYMNFVRFFCVYFLLSCICYCCENDERHLMVARLCVCVLLYSMLENVFDVFLFSLQAVRCWQ